MTAVARIITMAFYSFQRPRRYSFIWFLQPPWRTSRTNVVSFPLIMKLQLKEGKWLTQYHQSVLESVSDIQAGQSFCTSAPRHGVAPVVGGVLEGVAGAKWGKAYRALHGSERLHLNNPKQAVRSLNSIFISSSYTSAPATLASYGQYSRVPTYSQLCPLLPC